MLLLSQLALFGKTTWHFPWGKNVQLGQDMKYKNVSSFPLFPHHPHAPDPPSPQRNWNPSPSPAQWVAQQLNPIWAPADIKSFKTDKLPVYTGDLQCFGNRENDMVGSLANKLTNVPIPVMHTWFSFNMLIVIKTKASNSRATENSCIKRKQTQMHLFHVLFFLVTVCFLSRCKVIDLSTQTHWNTWRDFPYGIINTLWNKTKWKKKNKQPYKQIIAIIRIKKIPFGLLLLFFCVQNYKLEKRQG